MATGFLFAHGAGAPSGSAWMRRFAEHLVGLGRVRSFDYPYARGGVRKAPDKLEVLVSAHRAELQAFRAEGEADERVLLAGKSMGSRVGCHLVAEDGERARVAGLICFGYPLRGQNGKLRDQVLLALGAPILFVQGTRDALCPLAELDEVRRRMTARSELLVVEDGNHSLEASKTWLKRHQTTQADVEAKIIAKVREFCASL